MYFLNNVSVARVLQLCSMGHTLASADTLCLICEQNREYQAGLEIDRETARVRCALEMDRRREVEV